MQIKEIFVIRRLSCLSVVLLHVVSMVLMIQEESLASAAHTVDAFRTLLMFSTPAFIFISEFLLARSYPGGVPAGFLKKRGKVIFVPFLFIAAVDAILMKSVAEEGAGFVSMISKFLENVFLGNFIGYFILVIFQFYILHMSAAPLAEQHISRVGAVCFIYHQRRLSGLLFHLSSAGIIGA